MNFYSFDMKDPIFEVFGWRLSVQVVTVENLYALDARRCSARETPERFELDCGGYTYAGGQQQCAGRLRLTAEKQAGGLRVEMTAEHEQAIRCVKLVLRGLPLCGWADYNAHWQDVPPGGQVLHYPWPMRFPLLVAGLRLPGAAGEHHSAGGRECWCFRSEDKQVRPKRFAMFDEGELWSGLDGTALELIFEQDARRFSPVLQVPAWTIGQVAGPRDAYVAHLQAMEDEGVLRPLEQRADAPGWLRNIRFCATLHGMHWSGRVFNTYADMERILERITPKVPAGGILAYVAGWEGRYYWQYGQYRPDPRLGGEEGFRALCATARRLGVHLMPMFGGNCVNRHLPGYADFGPGAELRTAFGNVHTGNCPDWNQDRSGDSGWQVWLNPGSPAWRGELVRQITGLHAGFGFDAVFLDTLHSHENAPDHGVYEGIAALRDALLALDENILVVCEDWWDRLLPLFPMFLDEYDERELPTPDYLARYVRFCSFLGHNEPSSGTAGVQHERAFPFTLAASPGYIPTLSFADESLPAAEKLLDKLFDGL